MLAFFLCTLTECNFSGLKCRLRLTYLVTHVLYKLFTHTHTHLHCTDICITVFIDKECLSIHVNRQNALIHSATSIAPYLLTCLQCK